MGEKLQQGRIELGASTLEPRLSEASLVAAFADAAKPLVHNGPYRSYLLPKANLNGREYRPSVYFSNGHIASVHLTWADPQTEGGSAWEHHSIERERAIATEDGKWLAGVLGGCGSLTHTYTFDWGTISSGFNERSGFSAIVVSYNCIANR